jgi:hypothetical protein
MKGNGTNWRLEGDYFDGCNCKSICPCVFMLDPTEGDCKAVGAWHIEKGHFSDGNNTITLIILIQLLSFMLLAICLQDQR